jgi:Flp pilus assembly pilin Flp
MGVWTTVLAALYVKAMNFRKKAVDRLRRLSRDEEGATIAEYAILLAVVVVALIAVLGQLTGALQDKLDLIIKGINDAPTIPGP